MNQTDVFLVQVMGERDNVIYNILYHEPTLEDVVSHLNNYYHIRISTTHILTSINNNSWVFRSQKTNFLKTSDPIIRIRNLSLMETRSSWID